MRDILEADPDEPFDPATLLTRTVESGSNCLLVDERALPPEFFDLSTGLAGELLHKLGLYRIRLAGVVPDLSIHSDRFQDFVREANGGSQYRFFANREEAVRWLRLPEAPKHP